jgi:hypothetical protein
MRCTSSTFFKGQIMILDSQAEFSQAQQVLNTAISANVIDSQAQALGGGAVFGVNTRPDLGQGGDVSLVVSTAVAATGGTAPTLTIDLVSADDAALTVNPVVHFSTGAIANAAFTAAGTRLLTMKWPAGLFRRFVGLRYTITGGPLTTFSVNAFIAGDQQTQPNNVGRSRYSVV